MRWQGLFVIHGYELFEIRKPNVASKDFRIDSFFEFLGIFKYRREQGPAFWIVVNLIR